MARMRVFLVLVLALTCGGGLAFATYNYVQKAAPVTTTIPTTKVVVAASDLDIGAELDAKDVRVVDWPTSAVPQNVISDPNEVIGRGLILPIVQNEPFLPMKLAGKDSGSGLPPAIPPGMRAVSVRVNEVIGVAGYVLPGTHVDVVATVSPTSQQIDTTSKVILTDVQVLAAGTKIERDTENDKPISVNVVTLLVNPEESERLTLAANQGQIQLALRNPLDRAIPVTRGVKTAGLIGNPPPVNKVVMTKSGVKTMAPVPPAAPEPMTVEIIRGDKRAHEIVREQE
ncbi:MAG TPA: Flp pilus assembly protein CpaB [Vicinamibacterales bacterium]|nr:Flp pilus assembly protein CpaB [Vicinamibacterales bacterium]